MVNPEGSQIGGVLICQSGGVPIGRGPISANPEGTKSERSFFLSIRRGPNSERSSFCQPRGVLETIFFFNERERRDPKTNVNESKTHSEKY